MFLLFFQFYLVPPIVVLYVNMCFFLWNGVGCWRSIETDSHVDATVMMGLGLGGVRCWRSTERDSHVDATVMMGLGLGGVRCWRSIESDSHVDATVMMGFWLGGVRCWRSIEMIPMLLVRWWWGSGWVGRGWMLTFHWTWFGDGVGAKDLWDVHVDIAGKVLTVIFLLACTIRRRNRSINVWQYTRSLIVALPLAHSGQSACGNSQTGLRWYVSSRKNVA